MRFLQPSGRFLLALGCLTTSCLVSVASSEVAAASSDGGNKDKNDHCEDWAHHGQCETNVDFMHKECPIACATHKEHKELTAKEMAKIKSIYELSATDIKGNEFHFGDYKDHVIVFVNVLVADNQHSESQYKGMLRLQERLQGKKVKFLLFPNFQFQHEHDKIPKEMDRHDILAYFTNKGLLDDGSMFTIMYPVQVNGPDAHVVYQWAKYDTDAHAVAYNFDPYFLVRPNNGYLERRGRHHPEQLFEPIMEQFGKSAEL